MGFLYLYDHNHMSHIKEVNSSHLGNDGANVGWDASVHVLLEADLGAQNDVVLGFGRGDALVPDVPFKVPVAELRRGL